MSIVKSVRFLGISAFILLAGCGPQQQNSNQQITEYTAILATLEATRKDIHALHSEIAELKHEVERLKDLPLAPRYPDPAPAAAAGPETGDLQLDPDEPFIGNGDAEIAVVEFSDYQCPFCARYNNQTFPALKQKYIDSGKLKYVSLDFPLTSIHPSAMGAAVAATCAGVQNRFEPMRAALFANQASLNADLYSRVAAEIGLDMEQFDACLRDASTVAEIRRDMQLASSLGVTGTPSFYIGKIKNNRMVGATKLVGAVPLAQFEGILSNLQ